MISRSMAGGAGGSVSGGERYSKNSRRSDSYARTLCCDAPPRARSSRYRSICTASSDAGILFQRRERPPAHLRMPCLFVFAQLETRGFVELRQQVEGDVRRLIVRRVRSTYVMTQRPQSRFTRKRSGLLTHTERRRMHARHQSRGNRFHVAFHTRNLAGKKHGRAAAQLQRRSQQSRRIDVGVPVDLAEPQELRLFQARNQPQHPRLVAEFHVVLKADQVETLGAQVFLPKLHHGIWTPASAWIAQPHRFHRPEAERVPAAPRNFLNRQAGFKILGIVFRNVSRYGLRLQQLFDETVVLLAVERAVEVIVGAVGTRSA